MTSISPTRLMSVFRRGDVATACRQLFKLITNFLLAAERHTLRVAAFPLHHTDPFDRLLVAQAQVESMSLVTADVKLAPYGVPIVW